MIGQPNERPLLLMHYDFNCTVNKIWKISCLFAVHFAVFFLLSDKKRQFRHVSPNSGHEVAIGLVGVNTEADMAGRLIL